MGFLQIVSFTTDRIDAFHAEEGNWYEDTAGRRTLVASQLYADRNDPRAYVTLNWFDSHESAMVNSALPETDALAARARDLATDVRFYDLEPAGFAWMAGEEGLRTTLETSTVAPHTFAEDLDLDMLVPHGRTRVFGTAGFDEGLRAEAPARDIEHWVSRPIPDGFVVEYAYRTRGVAEPTLSAGHLIATVKDGLIIRLSLSCAGNWTAETEAQVVAETGSFGAREQEAVR
jgi:hypothetical protein